MDMMLDHDASGAKPIWGLRREEWLGWRAEQSQAIRNWTEAVGFVPEPGKHLIIPDGNNGVAGAVIGLSDEIDIWSFAGLASQLPEGRWHIETPLSSREADDAALGWALDAYRFGRYRMRQNGAKARLVWPQGASQAHVSRLYGAMAMARDLISTPANDLGPEELAAAVRAVGQVYGAKVNVIIGDDLLAQNYPLVHAVGRASSRAPRLVDLRWDGSQGRGPLVTLVGKGVCFDSGGLDIKSAAGMFLMKKDMGGAAIMLALARVIMDAGLPIRLRLLIPAVENAISGDAFRPSDVLTSRKGLTVEIGNTDAEGRLILADALTDADEEAPDLLIDAATLTGAARVALGPDLPAFFCDDDGFAAIVMRLGQAHRDPVWRLPLWRPYRAMMDSKIADISSTNESGMAGSITAAIFLKDFVTRAKCWAHFDVYAWNSSAKAGRREVGGEAMMVRMLYASIAERFAIKL